MNLELQKVASPLKEMMELGLITWIPVEVNLEASENLNMEKNFKEYMEERLQLIVDGPTVDLQNWSQIPLEELLAKPFKEILELTFLHPFLGFTSESVNLYRENKDSVLMYKDEEILFRNYTKLEKHVLENERIILNADPQVLSDLF
mmetsp:Transcript_17169/g.16391  ORF Transcript_17169/g.16391 Transcript_17169/m.16391 type:complete len:147 (-) Transcript_17169:806-1246(-)